MGGGDKGGSQCAFCNHRRLYGPNPADGIKELTLNATEDAAADTDSSASPKFEVKVADVLSCCLCQSLCSSYCTSSLDSHDTKDCKCEMDVGRPL